MVMWGAITFGVGMLIILMEWNIARKKKGGVTWTDQKRINGIFWVTCAMTALVVALIWMAAD